MVTLPATPDPHLIDGLITIQRQNATDNSFTVIYQGLPASITYDKTTEITQYGERLKVRLLVRAGCVIAPNDRVAVTAKTRGLGGPLVPLATAEVYTVQQFNDMGKLFPLGQILAYAYVQ